MAETTAIAWTHSTFNPWIGCTAVSEACRFCYARTLVNGRMGGDFEDRRRTVPANWRKPLAWNRQAAAHGRTHRVFCASLADVFDNQVPAGWRAELWDLIAATPHLTWQLLTKRPSNIARMLPPGWGDGWPHVWLGTTAEDAACYRQRWPHLAAVPARLRFLSYEPALGPIGQLGLGQPGAPQWVIAGGESGVPGRIMHPHWPADVRDQCWAAGVPFFFKQWGEWLPWLQYNAASRQADPGEISRFDAAIWDGECWSGDYDPEYHGGGADGPNDADQIMGRVGVRRAGNHLDGRQHLEFPA